MTTEQNGDKELREEMNEKYKDVVWPKLSESDFGFKRQNVFDDMKAGAKKMRLSADVRAEIEKERRAAESEDSTNTSEE